MTKVFIMPHLSNGMQYGNRILRKVIFIKFIDYFRKLIYKQYYMNLLLF